MIQSTLTNEIERMNKAIEWSRQELAAAPEGKLLVDVNRGIERYYWRRSPSEKKGKYLGAKDAKMLKRLSQKKYDESLIGIASAERARLEKALNAYNKTGRPASSTTEESEQRGSSFPSRANGAEDILARAYERMSPSLKGLVEPYKLDDSSFAEKWAQETFPTSNYPFLIDGLFSKRGEQMRSKSEVIIADLLEAEGIPYRYEQELCVDQSGVMYPDFTVLNTRTREEYLWEHLGAMGDPDYCRSALRKLNRYAKAGYLPGSNLLITMESADVPLDMRVVRALIHRYLK